MPAYHRGLWWLPSCRYCFDGQLFPTHWFFDVFFICLLVIDNDSFKMVVPKIFCKFQLTVTGIIFFLKIKPSSFWLWIKYHHCEWGLMTAYLILLWWSMISNSLIFDVLFIFLLVVDNDLLTVELSHSSFVNSTRLLQVFNFKNYSIKIKLSSF